MKLLFLFTILILARLSSAQMFPWQPNEVILNERDTFILIERTQFDAENQLVWFTNHEFDDRGINIHKTELDGETNAFYEETLIREDDPNPNRLRYRRFIQEHQDSIKRLEALLCYDEQNRLLWKHMYNHSGEVIDTLFNVYDENGLVSCTTWNTGLDWSGTVTLEDITSTKVFYSESGKFITSMYINKEHYKNGMESKSISMVTYQYDRSGNLLEERQYLNMRGTNAVKSTTRTASKEGLSVPLNRALDDSLQNWILYSYDQNNNLMLTRNYSYASTEPFYQVHCEYNKRGELIKRFEINGEGIQTSVELMKSRKKGKNRELTTTRIVNKSAIEEKTVSLMDESGRYLKSVSSYDGVELWINEWSYEQNGDQYQVELNEYYTEMNHDGSKTILLSSRTRWIYRKK